MSISEADNAVQVQGDSAASSGGRVSHHAHDGVSDYFRNALRRAIAWPKAVRAASRSRAAARQRRAGNRKRLSDIGAKFLSGGVIEIQGVRFHPSFPTFEDVLVENLYFENYNFFLEGSWVVLDIGANAGASSLWLARSPAIQKVYAFEPLGPTFNMLLANLDLNPALRAKIEARQVGLGAREESLTVPYHADHVMSVSSKGTFDECFTPTSTEVIKIFPASKILSPLLASHVGQRVFVKVDCEGAEYDILPNLAEAGLLRSVDVLIVEWHGGDVQGLVELLAREGFFCFIEWHRRDRWKIGMLKAVRRLRAGA